MHFQVFRKVLQHNTQCEEKKQHLEKAIHKIKSSQTGQMSGQWFFLKTVRQWIKPLRVSRNRVCHEEQTHRRMPHKEYLLRVLPTHLRSCPSSWRTGSIRPAWWRRRGPAWRTAERRASVTRLLHGPSECLALENVEYSCSPPPPLFLTMEVNFLPFFIMIWK